MGTYWKKIKSDRILAAVLMLALLAGGVGLGIHLLHRDALAMQTYEVKVVDGAGGVEGVTVEFWWWDDVEEEWSQENEQATDENGYVRFQYGWENNDDMWGYVIQEEEWFEFVDPPNGMTFWLDKFDLFERANIAVN